MHFWAKILSKRLAFNPFVSNYCLRYKCIDFTINKSFNDKNYNKLNEISYKIQNKSQPKLSFVNCSKHSRFLSSKSLSSESDSKDIKSDEKSDNNSEELNLKPSIKTKFKTYSDEDSEVIYDVSEEQFNSDLKQDVEEWDESKGENYLFQQRTKRRQVIESDYQRGETGVFDLPELVDLLRIENLKDIAVIEVPKELDYCEYMVLANATSKRHINAFLEYFNKVYKMKKGPRDPFLQLGTQDNSPDWRCVDMNNIVMHIFLKPTREYYDIETLWTVGHEYDDKTQRQETIDIEDMMKKHMKFLEEIKPKI